MTQKQMLRFESSFQLFAACEVMLHFKFSFALQHAVFPCCSHQRRRLCANVEHVCMSALKNSARFNLHLDCNASMFQKQHRLKTNHAKKISRETEEHKKAICECK